MELIERETENGDIEFLIDGEVVGIFTQSSNYIKEPNWKLVQLGDFIFTEPLQFETLPKSEETTIEVSYVGFLSDCLKENEG